MEGGAIDDNESNYGGTFQRGTSIQQAMAVCGVNYNQNNNFPPPPPQQQMNVQVNVMPHIDDDELDSTDSDDGEALPAAPAAKAAQYYAGKQLPDPVLPADERINEKINTKGNPNYLSDPDEESDDESIDMIVTTGATPDNDNNNKRASLIQNDAMNLHGKGNKYLGDKLINPPMAWANAQSQASAAKFDEVIGDDDIDNHMTIGSDIAKSVMSGTIIFC